MCSLRSPIVTLEMLAVKESLHEDDSGLLRPVETKILANVQYHCRLLQRSTPAAAASARIQKGLIIYVYAILYFSRILCLVAMEKPVSLPEHIRDEKVKVSLLYLMLEKH